MNFLGKTLTFLILFFSTVFMLTSMVVYATHRNWKELVTNPSTGLRAQLTAAQTQNNKLESDLSELVNQVTLERAARASAIAALESRSQDLTANLQRATDDLQKLQAEENNRVAMLDQAQKSQATLLEETTRLRADVLQAQQARDAQFARAVQLQDELNASKMALERLHLRDEELTGRLSHVKLLLEKRGMSEADALTDVPPRRDGVVTAVRENNRMIEISIGTDEGLRDGHELDVYRNGGTYLGRVVVRHTSSDKSVSEVIPDFRRGQIREGDRVRTKIR